MLLAIDVGNTQTVLGLYKGLEEGDQKGLLEHMWRIATNKAHTSDELRTKIMPLLASEDIEAQAVSGVALASVVPQLSASWVDVSKKMFKIDPFVVTAGSAGDLFQTSYANPAEIGADRVADAIAAQEIYGAPVVVVDFGTATNIEVVDKKGCFIGGIIAPGVETSAAALFSHAARLSATELKVPSNAIGHNTEEAVRIGIVLGEVDRVDGLIKRVFVELGYETPVIATGGLAPLVTELSTTITDSNPELTLEGLRIIYQAYHK